MNSKYVVGVGNIYATEALFKSKIRPTKQAGKVSLERYEILSKEIVTILRKSIDQGGIGLIRVIIMIGTSAVAILFFINSFIRARRNKN